MTAPTSADLARDLIAGLTDVLPAARLLRVAEVEPACRALPALGWTPLMLRRWAEHEDWSGTGPLGMLTRVRGLGVPPERPRSVEPARQDECPAHPGELVRKGKCDACAAESRSVDHEHQAAVVRAARRPLRAAEPVSGPRARPAEGGAL